MTTTLFAFVDFETTGLIEPGAAYPLPLEVAWTFTNERLSALLPTRQRFLAAGWDPWEVCHPVALEMHRRSGLHAEWNDWASARSERWGRPDNLPAVAADMVVDMDAVKRQFGADRVNLAGSGIGPFDVDLVRHYFPAVTRVVHYRPFDISPVRTLGQLAGVSSPWNEADRPHRAEGDVDWSVREGRWWLDWAKAAAACLEAKAAAPVRVDPADLGGLPA